MQSFTRATVFDLELHTAGALHDYCEVEGMAGICSTISCHTSRLRSWNATSIPANWLSMTLKSSALSFSHRCTSCTVQPCQPQLLRDAHAMSATDKPIFLPPHAAAAQAEALAADLWP